MAGQRRPPQARDRAIGSLLRVIREKTGLSLEAAARLMQWSPATMSRTENGRRHVSPEDVASILAIYGVPASQRDALVARAKAANEPGWWLRTSPAVSNGALDLAGYEAQANKITDWSINLIPGLLQISEYAKAYMLADGYPPEEVEKRCAVRAQRQQVLLKVDYLGYIGEAAVRTPFGGSAFTHQLKRLWHAPERGLGVRIVPEHTPHAALIHSWMLLEFPGAPPLAHVEFVRSWVWVHADEADPYFRHRAILSKIALSTSESRAMLGKLIVDREGKR